MVIGADEIEAFNVQESSERGSFYTFDKHMGKPLLALIAANQE